MTFTIAVVVLMCLATVAREREFNGEWRSLGLLYRCGCFDVLGFLGLLYRCCFDVLMCLAFLNFYRCCF
jgi:hypothetical protein